MRKRRWGLWRQPPPDSALRRPPRLDIEGHVTVIPQSGACREPVTNLYLTP